MLYLNVIEVHFPLCSWRGKEGMEEFERPLQKKKEMDKLVRGDAPAKAGGKRKLGSAGITVAEAVTRWKYYERMSFYKPFIYDRPLVHWY